MATRMLQRRGTASQWTSANPALAAGEIGFETDTGQFKIGDGSTLWNSLPYFKDTLDLDIASKAPLASPTFTGNVTLPSTTTIGTVSASEIATLDGLTASTAELNIMDGVTASTSEINKLSGLLASTSELNTLVGITATSTELNTLDGITASTAELNILDGVTSSTSELNILDGATLTTTELNYVDGVTSAIQTQLDSKAPTSSPTFTGTVSGITKSMVGLSNVDNTSDVNKPISTATQAALDAKLSLTGGTLSGTLTLSGAPTSDLHAATKLYVDNVTAGINFHAAAHVATTTNLSADYDNGTSGVGATLTATANGTWTTLDSHTSFTQYDRILVKDQTDAKQNGIYILSDLGSPTTKWVLTRATDADNNPSGEMKSGDFTFVQNGTTNGGFGFVNNSSASPIVIGTSNITYTEFNAAKTVVAGNGLQEATPGVLSIDTTITQARVAGVSDTEIGYLDGVTSSVQTQLDAKVAKSDYSAKGVLLVGTGSGTYTAQTVGSNGQVLTANSAQADGVEWTTLDALPSQTGNGGKYLTTDGSTASWGTINATPAYDDLSDVTITSATANDVVYFNGTSWVNRYVAAIPTSTNAQSGTTYTLVLGDAGKIVEIGNASAITLTIPTNASVAFPVGTQITILQTGAGQITVADPSGGTLNATPGKKLRAQWSSATLLKRATDTWVLIGDLTA